MGKFSNILCGQHNNALTLRERHLSGMLMRVHQTNLLKFFVQFCLKYLLIYGILQINSSYFGFISLLMFCYLFYLAIIITIVVTASSCIKASVLIYMFMALTLYVHCTDVLNITNYGATCISPFSAKFLSHIFYFSNRITS